MYAKLVAKVNNIDTNGFFLKTIYNTDKSENKICDFLILVNLLKNRLNARITEIESNILSISNFY